MAAVMAAARALAAALALLLMQLGPPAVPVHPLGPIFLTGYDDTGRTATGTWAGPGTCAVDPAVIPLGATIRIPGLGTCTALDTGGAIVGARLDVWFASAAACYAATGWYRGVVWWR